MQLNSRHRQPGTRVHRPRAGIFIVLIALVFNLFMVPASALSNFDFTVERMEVQIHIGADGHAIIEQVLEYSFLEESTSTTLVLDAGQSSSISLLSVDLTDSILNQPEPVRPADRGDNVAAMTYKVRQADNRMELVVHMPVEADSLRILRVKYQLNNSVLVYQDVADFNLTFVSPGSAVKEFSATIVAAKGMKASQVFAIGSSATVKTIDDKTGAVTIRDDLLRADEKLRIRCLLPVISVPVSTNKLPQKALDQILRDEAALAAVDSWVQDITSNLPEIRMVMLLLFPALLVTLFIPFRLRRLPGRNKSVAVQDIGNVPPPIASILIHRWTTGPELTAAMYDLAYRGYLRIEGDAFISQWNSGIHADLTDYDRYLIQWMMTRIGENGRVTTLMVTQAARGDAPIGFHQAHGVFRQLLCSFIRKAGLADFGGVTRGKVLGIAYSVLYASAAAFMMLSEQSLISATLLVPSALFFMNSLHIRRLTLSGKDLLAALKAFREYLKRTCLSDPSGTPPIKTWSRYLPYAIALGVEKQFLLNTGALYTSEEIATGGMFVEYGLTCLPDESKEQMLDRFYEHLIGNSAAMLTAALYGKEKRTLRRRNSKTI